MEEDSIEHGCHHEYLECIVQGFGSQTGPAPAAHDESAESYVNVVAAWPVVEFTSRQASTALIPQVNN